MINEVFASDETVALAKEKACKMLGVSEDKVDFEIRQFPAKKVFGMFGGRMAQVRAVLKKSVPERAVDFLKELFFYMGLESINLEVQNESLEFCEIKAMGPEVSYIVGKHGNTLDSLQYLVGFAANDKTKNETFCKIRLDAGDYREKRRKALEHLAETVSNKAIRLGRKINLEPMRAYERKIIHTAVNNIDGVKSWSEGEGNTRHIVVAPIK